VTVTTTPGESVPRAGRSPDQAHIAREETFVHSQFSWSSLVSSWVAALPSLLPLIFLLLATSTVAFLSVCTPPFQTPDEDVHLLRSYQVSNGVLFHGDGGEIDEGIGEAISHYSQLPHNTEAKTTAADKDAAAGVKWTGRRVYIHFATSSYAPTGYIPQAFGVALGRLMDLSVIDTLTLSRLLNGALAISISTLALCWCRRGKLLMFAILMMPMTMSLYGSCNQDASTISLACLALAIFSRQIEDGRPLSSRMTIVLVLVLSIVSVARPPYGALLLLLLVPGMLPRWGKLPAWLTGLGLVGIPIALTLAWWLASILSTKTKYMLPGISGTVDPGLQLLSIIQHPGVLLHALFHLQLYVTCIAGIIANLGWLDMKLPFFYYLVMTPVLLIAMIGEMAYKGRFKSSAMTVMFLAILCGAAGVVLSAYLLWDPVGSTILQGVQGRYFIPLAIAVGVALPPLHRSERMYRWATAVVVCGQVLTMTQLPWAIITRYYLR